MTRTLPSSRALAPAGFALACIAVYGASFYIAGRLPQSTNPGALAVGLTLDLVVLVPMLYHVLLVRKRGWPAVTTGVVFLVSLMAAEWVVPPAHQGLLRAMQMAGASVEVLLVGYVLMKAAWTLRRFRAEERAAVADDLLDRWRMAARAAFDVRPLADAIAYEGAVFYFAAQFFRRGVRGEAPGAGTFTSHRTSGYGFVVFAVVMVAVMEMAGGHLLLRLWSETAAWVHFALGGYGLIWFLGDFEATRRRFIRIGEEALHVRAGLRWSVRIPFAQIASVERAGLSSENEAGHLNAVVFGGAQLVVRTGTPVVAEGPYGITREVTSVGLRVDEPARFEALLKARMAGAAR